MIVDISATILIPGNLGRDCPGNGTHYGIECCCNECEYMLCCIDKDFPAGCITCGDPDCPRRNEALHLPVSSPSERTI